jgi:hypothetical protein
MIVGASCATGTRKPKTIGPTQLLRACRERTASPPSSVMGFKMISQNHLL